MKKTTKSKKLGVTAAGFTALFQGFEGLLYPLFGLIFIRAIYSSIGFSLASLAIKETITLIILALIVRPKKIKNNIKTLIFESRTRIFFIAGIVGTTTGNLFFIMAIQFAGAEYGTIMTAFYPIFAILINNVMIKKRENWKVWLFIFLATISALLFILVPTLIEGKAFDVKVIIGILLGGLAAFFWAVEGALIGKGLRKSSNKNLDILDVVIIRSIATVLISNFILMPAGFFISFFNSPVLGNPYSIYVDLLANYKSVLILLTISINLIVLRFVHIYAINKIGAKLTSIIDSNNFLVAPFFSIPLSFMHAHFKDSTETLYNMPLWFSWFFIIPILPSVMGILYFHQEHKNEKIEKLLN